MPKIFNFQVIIEQDEDGNFVASVPAIPGCHTESNTYEEALKNAKEAIDLCLEEAEQNKSYHSQINWPDKSETSRFLGITNIPVRVPSIS